MESIRIHRAFTLIELLVVLAIIGVIMVIVFTSQSTFNKTLILSNAGYDIALALRDAESYGIGSRATGIMTNVTNAGYGAYFQNSLPNSFILFADINPVASCSTPDCKPGDGIYTNGSDTLVQTYTLGNSITINNFCAQLNAGWKCENAVGSYSGGLTALNIVFARPNPNASISASNSSSCSNYCSATAACISITSPQGGSKFISVAASGEITANAVSCP
jgi:prepilin-type N-terminal cleavage/methylation domain-containing protein